MRFKIFITAVILIGGLVGIYLYESNMGNKQVAEVPPLNVDTGLMYGTIAKSLGIKDITYKQNGKSLELYYSGQLVKTIDIDKDLNIKALQDNLKAVGIEIGYTKDGSLVVKYKGEVVKKIG